MQEQKLMRGGIYWIENATAIGHEMQKTRPGVIVSHQSLVDTSGAVSVVFLTGSTSMKTMPEHVTVKSTPGKKSTAHCENVYTVDKSRLMTLIGQASADEMQEIDRAIFLGLFGEIEFDEYEEPYDADAGDTVQELQKQIEKLSAEKMAAVAAKQAYKDVTEQLTRLLIGIGKE